jgi:hypothetical protein
MNHNATTAIKRFKTSISWNSIVVFGAGNKPVLPCTFGGPFLPARPLHPPDVFGLVGVVFMIYCGPGTATTRFGDLLHRAL